MTKTTEQVARELLRDSFARAGLYCAEKFATDTQSADRLICAAIEATTNALETLRAVPSLHELLEASYEAENAWYKDNPYRAPYPPKYIAKAIHDKLSAGSK